MILQLQQYLLISTFCPKLQQEKLIKEKKKMLTWVNIAFADDIVSLVDISSGAKLSAMETTTKPARTIAR